MEGNSNSSVGSRAIQILRLHPPICVQSTFCAKLPLAHKELLYEVPSLRVTSVCLGGEMRQHRRFCDLGFIGAKRDNFSAKFCHFQIFHLNHDDLDATKTCRKQFSKTSRLSRIVLHKKRCIAVGRKLQTIGWIASNSNFKPAADRQPVSPRGRTRREGSACSPSKHVAILKL